MIEQTKNENTTLIKCSFTFSCYFFCFSSFFFQNADRFSKYHR